MGSGKNRYNNTPVLRDVQVAKEIRSMAALGQFPKEITVYGLVFYRDHQRQYMISAEPQKLIAFLNDAANQNYHPTPIERYSERLIIPKGYEEDIVRSIKLKLVRKLQAMYPAEIFPLLEQLKDSGSDHVLEIPLQQYRGELESVFQMDKIHAFQDLCTRAYLQKKLSEVVYRQLTEWCEKRIVQLEQYVPPMREKEKYFYGFAVLEDHKISRCVINANLSCIYEEKYRLEQQGFLVTAWHQHLFPVESQGSLRDTAQQMTAFLETVYDEAMIRLMERLQQAPSEREQTNWAAVLTQLQVYGVHAQKLGIYYGQKQGYSVLPEEKGGKDNAGSE